MGSSPIVGSLFAAFLLMPPFFFPVFYWYEIYCHQKQASLGYNQLINHVNAHTHYFDACLTDIPMYMMWRIGSTWAKKDKVDKFVIPIIYILYTLHFFHLYSFFLSLFSFTPYAHSFMSISAWTPKRNQKGSSATGNWTRMLNECM